MQGNGQIQRRGGDSNPRWTGSPYRFSRPFQPAAARMRSVSSATSTPVALVTDPTMSGGGRATTAPRLLPGAGREIAAARLARHTMQVVHPDHSCFPPLPARPGHETRTPPREPRGLARSSSTCETRGCPPRALGFVRAIDEHIHAPPVSGVRPAGTATRSGGAPLVARSGGRHGQDRRTRRTMVRHPPRAGRLWDPPPAQ